MMRFVIAAMVVVILYLALSVPSAGSAPAGRLPTHTPVPTVLELPTVTPPAPVPTDMPAYPAPGRHSTPKETPVRGLQCARC